MDDCRQHPTVALGARLRSEALAEMARRATAADPARSGARPLLSVVIDLPTLEGRADRPAMVEAAASSAPRTSADWPAPTSPGC